MKKIFAAALVASAVIAAPAAFAEEKSEGKQLAEMSFASVDRGGKGWVHVGDMEAFRSDVFTSMDYDSSNGISLDEFLSWDIGFDSLAEQANKADAYQTAMKIVFAFWDLNNDGVISESEHRKSVAADFARADLNSDAILSETEFLNGLSIMVAIRAAMKPDS